MLTTTNTLLLQGLKDVDDLDTWREFDRRYRPVLFGFARRLGLHQEDAAEAAQETLVAFCQEYRAGRYDRDRGRLRSWLFTLARTRAAGIHRQRDRARGLEGISALDDVPDPVRSDEIWEQEWRRAVIQQGLAELRANTRTDPRGLRAFELLCLEEYPAARVAEELGMTSNAVYVAKHRALERLRGILQRLEAEF